MRDNTPRKESSDETGERRKDGPLAAKRAAAAGAARGRFSAQRKVQAVMRLFRREDLDTLSRALGVTAGALSRWWEDFLAGGQAALKVRPAGQDPQAEVITRLRAKIGELTMENALLWDKTDRLEQNRPLPARRSRR